MNKKTNYLTSFFCFIFVLITCFSCKKNEKEKPIDTVTSNYSDSLAFNKVVEKPQEGDRILWSDKNIKIYVNHSIIEEGEEKLVIYSNKKDTLLNFKHDEGGRITSPFIVNHDDNVFVNFFEVWEGSGFLSKKNFYKLDIEEYKLKRVINMDLLTLLNEVKIKFNIKDSLYTKKGEIYNNYLFDNTCFNENGELPFSLTLFNKSKPELDNGLEGFKILTGIYEVIKNDSQYFLALKTINLKTLEAK